MSLSPEERILIRRATTRDPEAFAELYLANYDAVLRRVGYLVRSRQEAEDITSEAFLRAWNAIDRFEARDVPIRAWLVTIAERLAFKHLGSRRASVSLDDVPLQQDTRRTPDQEAERQAEAAEVHQALAELPTLQREVVSKRFVDELSYDEVGLALGKRPGNVRVIQHRALQAMRSLLTGTKHEHAIKRAGASR